jgi:hypothetical protein
MTYELVVHAEGSEAGSSWMGVIRSLLAKIIRAMLRIEPGLAAISENID